MVKEADVSEGRRREDDLFIQLDLIGNLVNGSSKIILIPMLGVVEQEMRVRKFYVQKLYSI